MAQINTTFASDNILSINSFTTIQKFSGNYVTDNILQFNGSIINTSIGLKPHSQTYVTDSILNFASINSEIIFSGIFRSDQIEQFGSLRLIKLPLMVTISDQSSATRYFIG